MDSWISIISVVPTPRSLPVPPNTHNSSRRYSFRVPACLLIRSTYTFPSHVAALLSWGTHYSIFALPACTWQPSTSCLTLAPSHLITMHSAILAVLQSANDRPTFSIIFPPALHWIDILGFGVFSFGPKGTNQIPSQSWRLESGSQGFTSSLSALVLSMSAQELLVSE